jgi:hypothetical protein
MLLLWKIFFPTVMAALPPQFSTCLYSQNSAFTAADVQKIGQVSKITYCQNQIGLTNKNDIAELLKNKNIQVGITLSRTTYSSAELLDLAKTGSYMLYVDTPNLGKTNLLELQKAGVQLVIFSSTATELQVNDLLELAKIRPFIFNVDSVAKKDDLKSLMQAGVQVVLRSGLSWLSNSDIGELAKVNPELISVIP